VWRLTGEDAEVEFVLDRVAYATPISLVEGL
jgi:hypothetical protein